VVVVRSGTSASSEPRCLASHDARSNTSRGDIDVPPGTVLRGAPAIGAPLISDLVGRGNRAAARGDHGAADRQGRRGLRQADQRTRHAHPLARRVRAVAQDPLHVLVVRGTRMEGVELELLGADQVEGLGSVGRAAMSRVLAEPPVNRLMLGFALSRCQAPRPVCTR